MGRNTHHRSYMQLTHAADRVGPEHELTRADFLLLRRAAEECMMEPEQFETILHHLANGLPLACASRERFDRAIDYLFGFGFRDPELHEVSEDYCAFLEAARRHFDISPDDFAAMLARAPEGGATPEHLTGEAFGYCLWEMFIRRGVPVPTLPHRAYMDRGAMGQLHAAVNGLGLTYAEHLTTLVTYGGGCMRSQDLDAPGVQRVLARYFALGWKAPLPPPRIEARAGYVSQPQVNLIWKLLGDIGVDDEAALTEWLMTVAGIEGGLPAITAAGARYVIDRLLQATIAIRNCLREELRAVNAGQLADAAQVTAAG